MLITWLFSHLRLGDDDDDDEDDYLERFFDDILGEDDDDDDEEDLSPSTGLVQQQQQQPAQPVQQTAQVATNAVEETPVGGTDYPGNIVYDQSKLLPINECINNKTDDATQKVPLSSVVSAFTFWHVFNWENSMFPFWDRRQQWSSS